VVQQLGHLPQQDGFSNIIGAHNDRNTGDWKLNVITAI
jgi:hypothetical protein